MLWIFSLCFLSEGFFSLVTNTNWWRVLRTIWKFSIATVYRSLQQIHSVELWTNLEVGTCFEMQHLARSLPFFLTSGYVNHSNAFNHSQMVLGPHGTKGQFILLTKVVNRKHWKCSQPLTGIFHFIFRTLVYSFCNSLKNLLWVLQTIVQNDQFWTF